MDIYELLHKVGCINLELATSEFVKDSYDLYIRSPALTKRARITFPYEMPFEDAVKELVNYYVDSMKED